MEWLSARDDGWLRSMANRISLARLAGGIAVLCRPDLTARAIGFRREHINESTRALARIFGVREVAVALLTMLTLRSSPRRRDVYILNALVDGGDTAVFAASLIGKRGIPRASALSVATALPITATWLRLLIASR